MSKSAQMDALETDFVSLEDKVNDLEDKVNDLEDRMQFNDEQIQSNEKLQELLERINRQHRNFIAGLSTVIINLLQSGNITEAEMVKAIELITKLCEAAVKDEE